MFFVMKNVLKSKLPIMVILILFFACLENKDSLGEDKRLEGKDMLFLFKKNPRTGKPYTDAEKAAAGYDPQKKERYSQCHPVDIDIWVQQKPKKIEITDVTAKKIVKSINYFSRQDRPDVATYKKGYGYQANWSGTAEGMGVGFGESKKFEIKVTYNDIGIGGFLTPSVKKTEFTIESYNDGKVCVDLDKDLVGEWRFDDSSNLLKATKGKDLVLGGNKNHKAVAGIPTVSGDGAAETTVGGFYEADHGLKATGGGVKVNHYTIIMDINVPSASSGKYVNLVQPFKANDKDGSVYVKSDKGLWVKGAGGATAAKSGIKYNTWHRVVISIGMPNMLIYVDGKEAYNSASAGGKDGNQGLDVAKVLFFADNNGEDYPIKISQIYLFNRFFLGDFIKKFPAVGVDF